MDIKQVEGRKAGKLMLYAISTCPWCRKTKALLNELGVEYSYIDVDLVPEEEEDKIRREVERWNDRLSFPTLVIDDEEVIIGFQEERIRQVLKGKKQ
ncbi:MAG TPA: glutaredoxin family protein [Candidatus Saccharicenans sp.]|nr:glutaredoxin family protein [Candidatus Saccharicenans sp.]HQO76838.1 glutaredoxin family protein [Candidatus Saccharicenans sp.]HUM79926.1 glutaredoxin family protein [Candidatus Saccharicenans sp.]